MNDLNRTIQALFTGLLISLFVQMIPVVLHAQTGDGVNPPDRTEGEGPWDRLVLRGGTLIDGTGAPPIGPVDIVIEGNRITGVHQVGYPGVPIIENRRPAAGDRELNVEGMYIMPGFIDSHGHQHTSNSGQGVPIEYVHKLWMAHGITTSRDLGAHSTEWLLDNKRRSEANDITAPRIMAWPVFGRGNSGPILTTEQAREWIQNIAEQGADGIKFFGAAPHIMEAALDEATQQGLGTTMHHAQLHVTRVNVLRSASMGLTSMEHWYGLPEAMFTNQSVQNYPVDYNYNDEQHRFAEAGRLWKQAAEPYSEKWNAVMDSLLAMDFTISPTFVAYLASRDLMRQSRNDWHAIYTMPNLWEFYRPDRRAHGSYWFDWTLKDELDWRENYRLWMTFVNEYKNRGGRVVVGSDSGYIYNLYGFGYIQEMELLQEAGFHPLEVIWSATLKGAEVIGRDHELGSIEVGKLADLVIVDENPLQNLKVLFGTGTIRLNDETGVVERVGGINWTIKDGILYDVPKMLHDVRGMVERAKEEAGLPAGPMPMFMETEGVDLWNWPNEN
ncbi:MAG: amidohydrolase family protein [Balneolaceae bacterium]